MKPKSAIILLSGGLDSAVTLYYAKSKGYRCLCLTFDYGQTHKKEIYCAKKIAKGAGAKLVIIKFRMPWKGSALLDRDIPIPERVKGFRHKEGGQEDSRVKEIPSTYVPGRNTIFLSLALSYAEAVGAEAIFIGANQIDFSGYPDCRPKFYSMFNKLIKVGTKAGANGEGIKILTPLINKSKADIVKLAARLKAPIELTWSCYKGGEKPCGVCDSCRLRQMGIREALIY